MQIKQALLMHKNKKLIYDIYQKFSLENQMHACVIEELYANCYRIYFISWIAAKRMSKLRNFNLLNPKEESNS